MIFFIYIYQKWVYPIEYKRVSEFGVLKIYKNSTPMEFSPGLMKLAKWDLEWECCCLVKLAVVQYGNLTMKFIILWGRNE